MSASWKGRVSFSASGAFAYRPGQILISPGGGHSVAEAVAELREVFGLSPDAPRASVVGYQQVFGIPDVELAVAFLRSRGFDAQPNHVLFGHSLFGNPLSGNPLSGNPLSGNPLSGNPLSGNPLSGNPLSGNPLSGNPFGPASQLAYRDPGVMQGRGYAATGEGRNLARPADPLRTNGDRPCPTGTPKVAVLDVALPDPTPPPTTSSGTAPKTFIPWLLQECELQPPRDTTPYLFGRPSDNDDNLLDRIAGHGLFVAGRIAQVEPRCSIRVVQALNNAGDGDEWEISRILCGLAGEVDIVNLSFGGYALEHMNALARAVSLVQAKPGPAARALKVAARGGAVVVASAGNDATWAAPYPAVLPGVISVGALGPDGVAAFSNYGPWVRASATGVEVASAFFDGFNGDEPVGPDGDTDKFDGAATWTGTSFAAPFVAGRIAQLVHDQNLLPAQAVDQLLDAPGLARIPWMGTIVT